LWASFFCPPHPVASGDHPLPPGEGNRRKALCAAACSPSLPSVHSPFSMPEAPGPPRAVLPPGEPTSAAIPFEAPRGSGPGAPHGRRFVRAWGRELAPVQPCARRVPVSPDASPCAWRQVRGSAAASWPGSEEPSSSGARCSDEWS